MRIKEKLLKLVVRALCESMDIKTMVSMARRVIPHYNYHQRLGVSEAVSIPNNDVARQIIIDMRDNDSFIDFICILLKAPSGDFNGRKYSVPYIPQIMKELNELGLIYDSASKMFMENPNVRRTKNWSVLKEGEEYMFTFLRMDIVGNTKLVRKNSQTNVERIYKVLKDYTSDIVEYRNGRIWRWDGDGGIIAFHFSNRNEMAVLSAIEILHRIFLFNHFSNPLDRFLSLRIAINSGRCLYTSNEENILHSDVVKKTIAIESKYTEPDSITITEESLAHLDHALFEKFTLVKSGTTQKYLNYKLTWRDE